MNIFLSVKSIVFFGMVLGISQSNLSAHTDTDIQTAAQNLDASALETLLNEKNTPVNLSDEQVSFELFNQLFSEIRAHVDRHYILDGNTDKMQDTLSKGAAITQVLINHGINVNARSTTEKITPLMLAVQNGFVPVVEVLLASGANAQACDANGNKVVDHALICSCPFALKLTDGKFIDISSWSLMATFASGYNNLVNHEACIALLEKHNSEDYTSIARLIKAGRSFLRIMMIKLNDYDNDDDEGDEEPALWQFMLKACETMQRKNPTHLTQAEYKEAGLEDLRALGLEEDQGEEYDEYLENCINLKNLNIVSLNTIKMIAQEGLLPTDTNELVSTFQELCPTFIETVTGKGLEKQLTKKQIEALKKIDVTILARITLRIINFVLYNLNAFQKYLLVSIDVQDKASLKKMVQELADIAINQSVHENNATLSEAEKYQLFRTALMQSCQKYAGIV